MQRIFVPAEHLPGVLAMLDAAGVFSRSSHGVFPVHCPSQMAGCEGAVFCYIENHSEPVSAEMLEVSRAYGLVELKFNDAAARARHALRYQGVGRASAYDVVVRRPDPVKVYR